ncbi:adenylate/guanylate cyclase domain-containing protein [Mycobacterium xenopi]|uniref:Adenylate cyclase n=1 Tax=Mycobacterium xenopi TaxID=1789 RepID=A0AAD1H2C5_MYCXE|nr:adenylate/guanylate cyclase domain-containing protein [Mycobacterium xenopi]EID15191.1 membrane-anchored adenylyl cyclase Cya [Mycobacterium xenopi RIVM700367]MDA3637902.1 adenylate/guanylate cyclase domain-containing protein [Mycobacterium xenopi]MDA3655971.1 adenylate/guanylate cyclase domain-containing protein [Mycobacterium xenopi]ORX09357.1 adenylate cyclase [Mycobacterium xenopi]SPX88606.1 membrane-anchored adenylyl cyclase Cya [Mycobacterium xenopi]
MAAKARGAPRSETADSSRTSCCVATVRAQPRARSQHYADSASRRRRVLNINSAMAVLVCASYAIVGLAVGHPVWRTQLVNLLAAAVFAAVPLLHRFGELVAPLTFICTAYLAIFVICWNVGTGSGLQFFFLVTACLVVLQLGIEHIALAATLAAIAAALVIALEFLVPRNTGLQPAWAQSMGFVIAAVSACVMVVVTMWYALREIARAEAVMEVEYDRSEALLANIMPASIAARLKNPAHNIIADKYDEASVLFADIAGFTERASSIDSTELIQFLDRLYTEFDALVDKHGLEKIKVSGDSYMVVSGVPWPRHDHVQALADLALDMADAAAELKDPHGRALPLRIGLATGPVVAGVVGSRRFFYDVWGDAVNVASRMESTDPEGRIQVPQEVYERLKDDFVLEERGDVEVKGKGVMHTWYLVGRKPGARSGRLHSGAPQIAGV